MWYDKQKERKPILVLVTEGEETVGIHLEVNLARHKDRVIVYGMAMRKNRKACFHTFQLKNRNNDPGP